MAKNRGPLIHGHYSKGSRSLRTITAWRNMHQRCYSPRSVSYRNYGARGIAVCERWSSFDNFMIDMGECVKGMTLERINPNGDYSPENCRWATYKVQGRNRRNNRIIELAGVSRQLSEACETLDKNYYTIRGRLLRGWSTEKAFSVPCGGWVVLP